VSEELELKFSYENGDRIARWLDENYPPTGDQAWRTLEIIDRYFDTPDLALAAAGYGARLRAVGSDTLLTVKADIEVYGGLHRRLELEAPATRSLSPDRWPESEAREQLLQVVGDRRVVERFVIGQQRRERELLIPGALVIASLDEGEVDFLGVVAGELRQFEVELRDGDAGALNALAGRVVAADLAVPEEHSKLAIAADLATEAARVAPDDSWSDAARKLLRRHLVRMLEREGATRATDTLALKQMRVATRRMRATWRVFDGAFSGGHARHFDEGLRSVAGMLGTVRDLDVLLASVEGRDDLAPLGASWRSRRDAAFAELLSHLESRAYARFVDDFLEGTGAPAHWARGRNGRDRVADLAPARLDGARDRMIAAAQAAQGSNEAAAWHALRITAKRMRYSLEAFREVLNAESATEFIEWLRVVQDTLGEMNDASVAAYEAALWLTSSAGADAPPEQRGSVARYIGQRETLVARARNAFAPLWQAGPTAAPFSISQIEGPPIN
jgi:triphosphatase